MGELRSGVGCLFIGLGGKLGFPNILRECTFGADMHIHADLQIRANRIFPLLSSFKFGYFTCFNRFFVCQASRCIVKSRIRFQMKRTRIQQEYKCLKIECTTILAKTGKYKYAKRYTRAQLLPYGSYKSRT
ncbi:hypothetical protein HanXRQr2_Chr16g0776491 [Helianthus annuus]|uniref:Uncharacterized protein n=1 Tax=Helianthus annuus TaxID=4232 RepID=A0A251S439_HELAN|nr:hypothetical protein HanXRQr2_Chr16g0776491 [Helianthus annuus]KAJ0823540.1 hypothetical protein HanPSC8_Chr16g0744931 [Helianthus annuus]